MKKNLLLGLSLAVLSGASFAHKDHSHEVTVGPANWYATETVKDRSVSGDVASSSDVALSHRNGWKGQGASVVASTYNKVDSATFHTFTEAIAPLASYTSLGNFTSFNDAVTYEAFVFNDKGLSIKGNHIDGVNVSGYTNSNLVGVQAVKHHLDAGVGEAHGNEVQFLGVHNAAPGVNDCQALKTAYIAGSAALIASKFPNLVAEEVVKNMNESRIDDKFSLTKSLSPKGTLR